MTTRETTYALIEAAALAGERCPMNGSYGPLVSADVVSLCRSGRIRVEISGKNFRQAFILAGPNAGKATAPNPRPDFVWKIIDHRPGAKQIYRKTARPRPSAPKDYSRGAR